MDRPLLLPPLTDCVGQYYSNGYIAPRIFERVVFGECSEGDEDGFADAWDWDCEGRNEICDFEIPLYDYRDP